jgi:hypothetical protein
MALSSNSCRDDVSIKECEHEGRDGTLRRSQSIRWRISSFVFPAYAQWFWQYFRYDACVDFVDQLRRGAFFMHGNTIGAVVVVDEDDRDTVEDRDRRSLQHVKKIVAAKEHISVKVYHIGQRGHRVCSTGR